MCWSRSCLEHETNSGEEEYTKPGTTAGSRFDADSNASCYGALLAAVAMPENRNCEWGAHKWPQAGDAISMDVQVEKNFAACKIRLTVNMLN